MRLLPIEQWVVAIEGDSLVLSAWGHGSDGDLRHWIKFDPSHPVEDRTCIDDLKGVFVNFVHAAPVGQ